MITFRHEPDKQVLIRCTCVILRINNILLTIAGIFSLIYRPDVLARLYWASVTK